MFTLQQPFNVIIYEGENELELLRVADQDAR